MSSVVHSSTELSDSDRRQIERLDEHVEAVCDGDRLFFEKFPARKHRVRPAHPAEVAQHELIQQCQLSAPAGGRLFTVVRNIMPGIRIRLCIVGPENAQPDVGEKMARKLFEALAPAQLREIEAGLRKAVKK